MQYFSSSDALFNLDHLGTYYKIAIVKKIENKSLIFYCNSKQDPQHKFEIEILLDDPNIRISIN